MIKFFRRHWLISLIIIIAAFMRLYRISDYMEFLGDQGRDVVIVRDFLKNGNLFFIGPQTSIGNMYLGPFYYYLIVAPGLILANFNPVGPSIVVALLGILTVYLIYRFGKSWFNPTTAYIASFLYAISPIVIKYSNFSWNPNIMPLFALLFFYFLTNSKPVLATLAFIVALNSHFLALMLLPPGLLIWFYQYSKHQPANFWRLSLKSVIVFVLSLTPQILFDIKHHGQNVNAILSFFTQRESTVSLKAYKALPILPSLYNQINTSLLSGKNELFGLAVSIVFFSLLVVEIFHQLRTKKYQPFSIVLLLWYLSGLVGLALYKQHVYDHYFGFLFPVVYLLFSYLLSKLPRFITYICLVILTIFSFLQNPFRWQPPRQLATTIAIDQSILDKSNNQPFNFALLAKMNYDPGYRYIFSEKNAQVELLQNKVTDQLFVVCEPFQIDCNPINNPEWGVAAFGWAKIDSQWEINGIKVFKLVHNESGLQS